MADDRFCGSCGQTLPVVDELVAEEPIVELLELEEPAPSSEADVVAEVAHHALDTIEAIVDAHETTDIIAELTDAAETIAEEESEEAIVEAIVDDEPDEDEPDEDDDEEPPEEDELDDEDETAPELLEPADEVVVETPAAPRRRRGLPMRR